MKDDVIPEKSKRAPSLLIRECRKIIVRKESQDIRLPNLSGIFFNFVKFYYQYSFTNDFCNIKNTFFSAHIKKIDSFLERKPIASNLNSNPDSTELSSVGGNASGRKEEIFLKQSFSIILNQQQFFNTLTIFSSYPSMNRELEVHLWRILTPSLLGL